MVFGSIPSDLYNIAARKVSMISDETLLQELTLIVLDKIVSSLGQPLVSNRYHDANIPE